MSDKKKSFTTIALYSSLMRSIRVVFQKGLANALVRVDDGLSYNVRLIN